MTKLMVFIDGTWLYSNLRHLAKEFNQPGFYIDYGVLPKVLKRELEQREGFDGLDLVRTFLFGSYPVNYDIVDEDRAKRRRDFFSMLREEYHYEVDVFPIDYQRRRILHDDRSMDDSFAPKEKCVDIALASSMMYNAAIPGGYDIAIAVIGDKDYFPVLQKVRQLGKRVAIASIRQSCAKMYTDRNDDKGLKDYDVIWLRDIMDDIALKHQEWQVECSSPLHEGERGMVTTIRLREGQPFFCDDCRTRFSDQKEEHFEGYLSSDGEGVAGHEDEDGTVGKSCEGLIENLKQDRGFGFIKRENGFSYFFHMSNLTNVDWESIHSGVRAKFTVIKEPDGIRAGAADDVTLLRE